MTYSITDYRVEIRDQNYVKQAQLDTLQSLEYYLNFDGVGTWVIDTGAYTYQGLPVSALNYVVPGCGIVVSRKGNVLFSGPMTSDAEDIKAGSDVVTFAGVTDDTVLADNIALPCASPFTSQAYDTRTGAFETVAKAYITANLVSGGSWASGRAISALSVQTNTGAGLTVTGNARYDQLDGFINALAVAGGQMGYQVVQVGNGIQFQVYTPVDRTATAKFSFGLGNLLELKKSRQISAANAFYVGGGGVGTARQIVVGSDSTSIALWNRRIERFVDRRDTTDTPTLNQEIATQITNNAAKYSLGMQGLDTGSVQFQRDYNLGDKGSFVDPSGAVTSDIIRQIHGKVDGSGETITPVIGSPNAVDPNQVLAIYQQVDALKAQLRALQGRQ